MPKSIAPPVRPAQWFDLRFIEDHRKVQCDCQICARPMWLPSSKAGKYLTCGSDCAEKRRASIADLRRRNCLTCAAEFIPRPGQLALGGGKYCCVACAEPARKAGRTPEVAARRGLARKAAISAGLYVPASGDKSPSWKGGLQEHLQRRKESGAHRESIRKYREKNPEKVREFTQRRQGRMTGSLPRGTVKRIGESQTWKCVVCRIDIRNRFHVDHIQPLARGGQHVALNIQLLCPTCNTRKSAKDPVDFMQEQGFLL